MPQLAEKISSSSFPETARSAVDRVPVRETSVIELSTRNSVGSDERGSAKVKKYMQEVSEILGTTPICDPRTHLSPKYGFSGWLPSVSPAGASAIHTYIWDDRDPSFVSIDFSNPQNLSSDRFEELKNHAADFFAAEEMVTKTNSDLDEWWDIDTEIVRQRLSLRAKISGTFTKKRAGDYLRGLCSAIEMDKISEPIICAKKDSGSAWMHWETSGAIASWTDEEFDTDIYTCKKFDSEFALKFTRGKVGEILDCQNF